MCLGFLGTSTSHLQSVVYSLWFSFNVGEVLISFGSSVCVRAPRDTTDSLEPHTVLGETYCAKKSPRTLHMVLWHSPNMTWRFHLHCPGYYRILYLTQFLFFLNHVLYVNVILQKCKIKLTLASTSLSEKQFVNTDFDSA